MTKEYVAELKAEDLVKLSEHYKAVEGPTRRSKVFSHLWLAAGFQFRGESSRRIEEIFGLMGEPDLASGSESDGMVGWLLHSSKSDGSKYDSIVILVLKNQLVSSFGSASVEPECSPARQLQIFTREAFFRKSSQPRVPE
jgi:hypothetical protein